MTKKDGSKYLMIHKIERGMIFWVDIKPIEARGSEQIHNFPIPWIVMSKNDIHQRMAVVQGCPLTTQPKDSPSFRNHRIRISAADVTHYDIPTPGPKPDRSIDHVDMIALTEQTRVLAHERLMGDPIAIVPPQVVLSVEAGIHYVM
jgi:mRNA-degrading endonuclease toxin of MazEF toxin-antitoxin module